MAHDREDFNIYDDIEFDNNNNANDEIYSTKEPYESQQPPEPTQQVTERRASPEHDSFSEEPALDYSQYKDVKDLALYISNMKWFTTDQQIEDLLHPFGRVAKIRFVEDKVNGKSRGSCFAAFEEPFNAVSAYEQLKNVKLDGNPLELRITSSSNFEQLNTHTRGRKERKEFMSSKGMDGDTIGAGRGAGSGAPPTGGQANGGNVGGGNPQGGSGFSQGPSGGGPGASFRNQEGGGGFRGRGGYRGRGRGGPPFRGPPMIPDVPQMPPPMVPPEFEGPPGGFMPPGRGHRYPFPPFGMPPFATHVNPAFLNMRPDPRDPREFERDPRDFDRDFDRSRDDRDRDRDRSSDRDRDREKDRDRDRERERERERDRDRDRGRDRDRDRDRASSSGSDDRYNKRKREEEDRKRDRHRSHRD